MSQTVNGVTTNYVLDSALPLTQVLSDGTNTYLYGIDRIAQVNGGVPEYFLTDGLGSVRQLVDSNGAVILAKNFDPYGTEIGLVGNGLSSYGFTGEMADPTGLLYLRARYYASGMGRFLTRDVWEGDINSPMSFNRWMYGYGNPVKYTDPTGMAACVWDLDSSHEKWTGIKGWYAEDIEKRVDFAETYVPYSLVDTYIGAGTYVAAGIAIQCAGNNINSDWYNSGSGIAQISLNQASTEWRQPIYALDWWGNKKPDIDPKTGDQKTNKKGDLLWQIRSYGLRCNDPDGQLETPLDPNNTKDAVELMRREIKLVIDACGSKCTHTDRYIAAALAQNGPGFSYVELNSIKTFSDAKMMKEGVYRDWVTYFQNAKTVNTKTQLNRFILVVNELKSRNWLVPYIKSDYIDKLK